MFEDDPYVELRFSGEPLPTMLSLDPERVVYASSFSKTVCPGIRVGYLVGPPELIAEIAHSSRAIDLNQKRQDYERAGVLEYVVLCIEEKVIHWFDFPFKKMIPTGRDGVLRSRVFPGLWLHGQRLLERDSPGVLRILKKGLASRAHAAFVRRLEKARRGNE